MSIPGLNAAHQWRGLVWLNDKSSWPQVKLRRLPGFHTRPETQLQSDLPAGRMGELPRRSFKSGKSIVYEGNLRARDQASLESFRSELLAAFGDDDVGQMVITPYDLPGPPRFFNARVSALDIPEELPPDANRESYGYERPFTLGLRLHDPRFYDYSEKEFSTAPMILDAGTSLPWTLPVVIASSGTSSGGMEVENEGTCPTPFEVDLYGPVTNPRLLNLTIDRQIAFKDLSIATGQFVRVNYFTGEILLNGTEDVSWRRDPLRTDWWDMDAPDGLVAGINELRYTGDVISDPAIATIRYHDAFWG